MNDITFSDEVLDDPALIATDGQAVQRFVETGTPIDPLVRARVFARSARIREQLFQKHGYIDIGQFCRPSVTE